MAKMLGLGLGWARVDDMGEPLGGFGLGAVVGLG